MAQQIKAALQIKTARHPLQILRLRQLDLQKNRGRDDAQTHQPRGAIGGLVLACCRGMASISGNLSRGGLSHGDDPK
jgi:hypothetical protein